MLDLKNVQYQFKDSKFKDSIFFDFSLNLKNGESLAIIGSSGSGKSTLLNLIAGFIFPSKGIITFSEKNNNQDITFLDPGKRPVNMLFQEHNIFNHLTVFDNVALGLSPGLRITKPQHKLIEQALEKVGLDGFNTRFPYQLSGGQKQRLAIARALIRNKPILLLDEAFASLDPPLKTEMLDLVHSLQKEHSLIMLMVTHNYKEAARICDKTCFIDDGKILHIDNTKQFLESAKSSIIKKYISCI